MAVKTYQNSKDRYLREKVDTFVLRVPKGKKDEISEYAANLGMSLNGYITSLVFADMGIDAGISKKAPASKSAKEPKSAKPATPKNDIIKEQPKKEPKVIVIPAEPDAAIELPEYNEEKPQAAAKKKKNMPSFLL